MPFYSWLRMTRAISTDKTYVSTVGCLRRILWFQESLRESLLPTIPVAKGTYPMLLR